MANAFDFKKEYKQLYSPKTTPAIVDIPEMLFIAVDGQGDPNTAASYKNAVEVLYGLSYAIKMSKMGGKQPEGYFDYVVPPLEGLWWLDMEHFDALRIRDKSQFHWTSLIRQPDFVTSAVFEAAKEKLLAKRPHVDLSVARLLCWKEGLCVQVMHIGPYDDEPATIQKMDQFVRGSDYVNDFSEGRHHHEIYLSDPLKAAPEKMKTVIRHPVRSI